MPETDNPKTAVRRQFLETRRAVPQAAWTRWSSAIAHRVMTSIWYKEAAALLAYVSARDNEVDTHALIDAALAAGKQVLIPVLCETPGHMRWSLLRDRKELERDRLGLYAPVPECMRPMPPPDKALCIVPGVAFTRDGQRIGYGGGYYDRFLTQFPGTSVGLAFDAMLADRLPVDGHDRAVDYVATESAWFPSPEV